MAALGLGNANLRLVDKDPDSINPPNIIVELAGEPEDTPEIDEKGNILQIKHGDGSVSVSIDGKPLGNIGATNDGPKEWFDNLAVDTIPDDTLNTITEELLVGIAEDLESRKEWIGDRALGLKLLGLKIELPNVQGASDGAPVEGMSKVRHPLLLEAVLRFQANARSELLPTDGPIKIRNDSTSPDDGMDQLANALEMDLNHYLTAVATEYYPDTDRMLFMTGFGGDGFKKVYTCPLRNRPVSESVDADDLIVNQSATDLANAQRVTHRSMMKPSTVKRLQILKVYRDVELGDAVVPQPDELQREEKEQQGLREDSMRRPENREREIYECYCELDIPGLEHKIKGEATGLQIPYVVTIDKSSRKALAVRRNFDEGDDLPKAKKRFVKYPFVPGNGFYAIGLLHILGNTTNAITAAWREMLDNGMFANFPGFLISKSGTRQNTSIFRVPPGGGASVDTQGQPINTSIMPLPYETAHMAPMMALVQDMAETGRRIGGTAEVQVGEGRADVPVGTVMAMIDQAVKVMNAVHKRMHAAQAEEFQLLKQEIKENSEAFLKHMCKSKMPWDKEKFMQAINNCEFVPQADPNTSSSGQRLMKVVALKQLQATSPTLYDPIKVDTAALAAIGWPNPEEFFVPPAARAAPPPELQEAMAKIQTDKQAADAKGLEAQARMTEAQAKAAAEQEKIKVGHYAPQPQEQTISGEEGDTPVDVALAQAKILDSHTKARQVGIQAIEAHTEAVNREKDRDAKEKETLVGLAKELIEQPKTSSTGADGQKKTSGGAPKASNAGEKAVKIAKQLDKGLE
jgi:hypothetical protein